MGAELIRPGDITDAADAEDLLRQLEERNAEVLDDHIAAESRRTMKIQEDGEIYRRYDARAREYYERIWEKCGGSAVGHTFANINASNGRIDACEGCSKAKRVKEQWDSHNLSDQQTFNRRAQTYEDDLVRNLAKQLMQLDEDAGLLVWPKEEDFIGREGELGRNGKKRRWGR